MPKSISFYLNNKKINITINNNWTLLHLIRNKLKLKGTKKGCGSGECGACTVIVNGNAINSCISLAIEMNKKNIYTIEGLKKNNKINILQKEFIKKGAIQCGFCTPGMIMSSKALLKTKNKLNKNKIKHALSGNFCRCTGYTQIIKAIQSTVKLLDKNKF